MKNDFESLESTLNIIEPIAKKYPTNSKEYISLELAAKALSFIYTEGFLQQFNEYLNHFNLPLTTEQKDFLKRNGLEE